MLFEKILFMKSFFSFALCACVINTAIGQGNEKLSDSVKDKYAVTIAPSVLPYAFIGLQPGFHFNIGKIMRWFLR